MRVWLFRFIFLFPTFFCVPNTSRAQNLSPADSLVAKMEWFENAKLGIFIHWGIYAVDGVDESWSFYNRKISWADYMKQLNGFTAKSYNPAGWAQLIKESGATYAVITTKHHDGVALWDTRAKHYAVTRHTPAARDLLAPFFLELRKQGLKTGAYFSLIDWSHPDYPAFLKDSTRYRISDQPQRWQKFREFYKSQISEIQRLYNPDLWWFDGDWEHNAAEWEAQETRQQILSANRRAIINGRLAGFGDYETPEQNFPVRRPDYRWWELCMTTNNNWGYQPSDTNWKTPLEIITIFADVISHGGNLLLDIGPRADGTIPAEQVDILRELGTWNKKHADAIFKTSAGIPAGHVYCPTTLSKDSATLYLFLTGQGSTDVMIKGLDCRILSAEVLGKSRRLEPKVVGKISWSPVPGLVYLKVPEDARDKYMTVVALKLDRPIRLYRGRGGLQAE